MSTTAKMETVTISRDRLDIILKDLESAIRVCYDVDYSADPGDPKSIERTAPYIVGYSRATMQQVLSDLKKNLN